MSKNKANTAELDAVKNSRPRPPTKRRLLITALTITAVAASFLAWHMRPAARANRVLTSAGLAKIPESTHTLRIAHSIRPLLRGTRYVKFSAEPNAVARWIEKSPSIDASFVITFESAHIMTGPSAPHLRWPDWFRPLGPGRRRMYNRLNRTSGLNPCVIVDDESNTVYIIATSQKDDLLGKLFR